MRTFKIVLVLLVLALAAAGAFYGCGPASPTPMPSGSPTPTASPSPRLVSPLHATSSGFVDAEGHLVRLRGVSYIPPDSKVYGWPTWVDDSVLDEVQAAGGNFVAVRLGPFSRDGEGIEWVAYESVGDLSRVNLDRWNPSFWARVRAFAGAAAARGIYVEFDLIDAWVLEHGLSPWAAGGNVNGYDGGSCEALSGDGPDYRQQQWLNKVGEELGPEPNVIFQISNESGPPNCQNRLNPNWEIGVYQGFKRNLAFRGVDRPVGTNSGLGEVEARVDYVEVHGCGVSTQRGQPSGVNEWNCALPPADFCRIQRELTPSQWFILWGDGMSIDDWKEALKCLRD